MPVARHTRPRATRYTPLPTRGSDQYSPTTPMSEADGWSPCCCGTKCGWYIFGARKAADGRSKDLCGKCRVAVRNDLFERLSAELGILGHMCALYFIFTGLYAFLTDPKGSAPTSKRLGHLDPTKSITRNLSGNDSFNAFPTSQLLEQFVGSDNINDMLAPNNIVATAMRFNRWFSLRSDVERKAFTPSPFTAHTQSPVTSITERLQLVEKAMGSPMNVDGANVSNTGVVTLGVDLRSRNARPTAIYTASYLGGGGTGLVFEGIPYGIGSLVGAGPMDIVSEDMPSGIGSNVGAEPMDIVSEGIPPQA